MPITDLSSTDLWKLLEKELDAKEEHICALPMRTYIKPVRVITVLRTDMEVSATNEECPKGSRDIKIEPEIECGCVSDPETVSETVSETALETVLDTDPDAVPEAVQAAVPEADPTPLKVGQRVSLVSSSDPFQYIRHFVLDGFLQPEPHNEIDVDQFQKDATFIVRPGLADPTQVSFEAAHMPGHYLRHWALRMRVHADDATRSFKEDATFQPVQGLADEGGLSFRSFNYPESYIQARGTELWLDPAGGRPLNDADATFRVAAPLT